MTKTYGHLANRGKDQIAKRALKLVNKVKPVSNLHIGVRLICPSMFGQKHRPRHIHRNARCAILVHRCDSGRSPPPRSYIVSLNKSR